MSEPTDSQETPIIPIVTGIPITRVVNENWRGKNDPIERRRIQNRLNQRAFRQRQRSGGEGRPDEQIQRSNSEASSSTLSQQASEDDDAGLTNLSPATMNIRGLGASRSSVNVLGTYADDEIGRTWDELAMCINQNFMSAVTTNAHRLGLDMTALSSGVVTTTPRPPLRRQVTDSLTPVELQYQVQHDPIIDTIPHPRLRANILQAIATEQIDSVEFSKHIRASGASETTDAGLQRIGFVVWSGSDQGSSWELSEPFVRQYASLLQGCEDLVAVANSWRASRGESLFPASPATR